MKKITAVFLVCILLLTSACGDQNEGTGESNASAGTADLNISADSDDSSDMIGSAVSDGSDYLSDSGAEASAMETEDAESMLSTLGVPASSDNTFIIYQCREYSLTMIIVQDFLTSGTDYVLRLTNHADFRLYVNISEVRLNGELVMDDIFLSAEASEVKDKDIPDVSKKLNYAGYDSLQSVTGSYQVEKETGSGSEKILGDTFELTIPENYQPELLYESCLGTAAEAQILADNDSVRISLLGAGAYHCSNTYYNGSFCGIVSVENKTDYTIPVAITGITINGMSLSTSLFSSNNVFYPENDLQPHMVGNMVFTVPAEVLSANDITTIRSAALTILSSESEKTSYVDNAYSVEGGTRYSLELSAAETDPAENSYQPVQENLIYDENDIRIYTIRQGLNSNGFEEWDLWVENDSDEGISFACSDDSQVDGVITSEVNSFSQINARSSGECIITNYGSERYNGYFPSLSTQLIIKSAGGDRVIDTIDDLTFEREEYELLADTGDVQIYYANQTELAEYTAEYTFVMFNICSQTDTAIRIYAENISPDTVNSTSVKISGAKCFADQMFTYSAQESEVSEISFCLAVENADTGETVYTSDMITLSLSE